MLKQRGEAAGPPFTMGMRLSRIIAFLLSFVIAVVPVFGQDRGRTDRDDTIRLRQDSITRQDDTVTLREDTIRYREDSITHRVDTITFREDLVRYLEDSIYHRFGESINGIYVIRLQNREYINARIIIDGGTELNVSRIVGNLAIGGAVIITSVFLPMLSPAFPPLVATVVKSINTAHVVQASLAAAALDAGISGVTAHIQSGGNPQDTFNRAIEGASSGFAWGAVLFYGTQLSSVAVRAGNATTIKPRSHSAGQAHPVSGVRSVERIIEHNGRFVRGSFPEFPSKFEARLPTNLFRASDYRQFVESNRQLRDAIRANRQLERSFSRGQLQQIRNGATPDGFVWHHHEMPGRMQLVDFAAHQQTPHIGGRYIWGGGSGFR